MREIQTHSNSGYSYVSLRRMGVRSMEGLTDKQQEVLKKLIACFGHMNECDLKHKVDNILKATLITSTECLNRQLLKDSKW